MPAKKITTAARPAAKPTASSAKKEAPKSSTNGAAKAPASDKKVDYLAKVQAILEKKLPNAHVGRAGDGKALSEVRYLLNTGLEVLDKWVIGRGGLPGNRMIEIFGDESSGKTALLLAIIAAFQQQYPDGFAGLCDSEHSYETPRAQAFDVDTNRLLLVQPLSHNETRDALIGMLEALPDGGPPSLIGWDSVAGVSGDGEADAIEAGKSIQPGEAARLNAQICRRVIPLAARKNVTFVIVNQTRMKIGVVFGDPTATTGGKAIPFFCAVRLQLWGGKAIKVGDNAIGRFVTVRAFKNKVAPPWRKCKLKLDFGLGWDDQWSTLSRAKDLKLIPPGSKGREAYLAAREKLEACKWGASMGTEPVVAPADEDGYEMPPEDDGTQEEV